MDESPRDVFAELLDTWLEDTRELSEEHGGTFDQDERDKEREEWLTRFAAAMGRYARNLLATSSTW